MLSEKTFTRSQIVSVTAAATLLVMAVSTDSGVSRGGLKVIKENAYWNWKFVCLFYQVFLCIMFPEIMEKSNSQKIKIHKIATGEYPNCMNTLRPLKWLLKVRKIQNDFFRPTFLPKNDEQIRLYYLSICFRSFFGRKWRHQKDISKLTDL